MTQKHCANLLKVILLIATLILAVVYFAAAPYIAFETANDYPEYGFALMPWLIFVIAGSIPVFLGIYEAWGIFTRIGEDKSFCSANAKAMKHIAVLAAIEGGYLITGDTVMALFVVNHPGIFMFFIACALAAFMVCGVCACLTMLISKACSMQEEIDLTI